MSQLSTIIAATSGIEDRRSACPGLFRMAKALDGSICRVKLTFGNLSAEQAHRIADASRQFGNGIIEITNRANLQIRGVRPDTENPLIAALLAAGLGPLTDRGDDVRNVMISPIAGVLPRKVDVRPLASQLLETLQTSPAYQTLSPKFSIFVDGGESVAMVEHPHDIWLSALDANSDNPRFAFGVTGTPPTQMDDIAALGIVGSSQAFDLVTAMLDLFIQWNATIPAASRLRHMMAAIGTDAFVTDLEKRVNFPVRNDSAAKWRRTLPRSYGHLGLLPERSDAFRLIGAMPPLGRLSPDKLDALARLAEKASKGKLRVTPWQSVLLLDIPEAATAHSLRELEALDFATQPDNPRATMISCSGSAGCGSALAATQSDGLKLGTLLQGKAANLAVHLTGCTKSCASPSAKPVTLVATEPGYYDIFLRATNGPSRFGKLLAAHVTIEEAADCIGNLPPNSGSGGPTHA
ncbi:precorrin-3B synthase [Phyllobacterium meliloti]|uniref:precorrin-3B synthase n=1 Tax=Phyllobacterium meliloti TaxID=555317 RepID=UPI001D13CBE0|nr:precorrin-3B synthase [Phyllobacterium sp. T1293]UGX86188.1 precorrin-3B synthase [Phyllobacterium sp. T1293]